MDSVKTLNKLLQIRENEKNQAQKEHAESVNTFEQLASDLYKLLKKKEQVEEELSLSQSRVMSIGEIQSKSIYLENLMKKAILLQEKVNEARTTMEQKRTLLTEAHIEMSKVEKLIEFRVKEIRAQRTRVENMQMDEISIQQYMAKNG